VKEAGLLIDFYQPSIYNESVVKKVISDFHLPLIRILKMYKSLPFSISVPLSTVELWEDFGFESLISELRGLCQNENQSQNENQGDRIEMLSSSPYGVVLNGLPENIVESQIILNEYGLGYYFGSTQGFEGDPSVVLKDIDGFVSSSSFVDDTVIKILNDLGYKWVAIENEGQRSGIFGADNCKIKIVNTLDMFNISSGNMQKYVNEEGADCLIIKLSPFKFCRFYENKNFSEDKSRDIMSEIESFLYRLSNSPFVFRTVGKIVESKTKTPKMSKKINDVVDDGVNKLNVSESDVKKREINKGEKIILSMCEYLSKRFNNFSGISSREDLPVIKIWDLNSISDINDIDLRLFLSSMIVLGKISYIINYGYDNVCTKGGEDFEKKSMETAVDSVIGSNKEKIDKLLSYIEDADTRDNLGKILYKR
jgi:hypothetical protein